MNIRITLAATLVLAIMSPIGILSWFFTYKTQQNLATVTNLLTQQSSTPQATLEVLTKLSQSPRHLCSPFIDAATERMNNELKAIHWTPPSAL